MPRPLHCRMITSSSLTAWHSGSSPGSPVRTCVKGQSQVNLLNTHQSPQIISLKTQPATSCMINCTILPSCTCYKSSPGIWCQIGEYLCQLWHSCEEEASYLKQKHIYFSHSWVYSKTNPHFSSGYWLLQSAVLALLFILQFKKKKKNRYTSHRNHLHSNMNASTGS